MALAVIGAGFGRTGTMSMKTALEMLGLGPCHHMLEVNTVPEQRDLWRAIAAGGDPDWERVFSGYRSSIDWPAAYFWRELSEFYPRAKILLTVRSPESWYRSMTRTIFPALEAEDDRASVGVRLIAERVFGGVLNDKAHALAIYERHIADVQAAFDDTRLLTYAIGDGWGPLCRFLDRPVPCAPFPRSNSADEFNADIKREPRRR